MIMFGSVCKNIEEPLLYFRFDEGTYKKRKSLINTKTLLSIRYKAYRLGFCSIFDFATVAISQLTIYFLFVTLKHQPHFSHISLTKNHIKLFLDLFIFMVVLIFAIIITNKPKNYKRDIRRNFNCIK